MDTTTTERLLCSVNDAAEALGFGRSTVYELCDRGEIKWIKEGRARRVVVASLRDYVERKSAEQSSIK